MTLYHFTDTARLPWIMRSGQLQPGRNKIGGFPDPDFIWATTDSRGDYTASMHRGEGYQSGMVRHVRFTLSDSLFFPWSEAPRRFPQWTPDHVLRLERAATGKSSPGNWWCRDKPLALADCTKIETRSWSNPHWMELKPAEREIRIGEDGSGGLLPMMCIAGRIFGSSVTNGPDGQAAYIVQAA